MTWSAEARAAAAAARKAHSGMKQQFKGVSARNISADTSNAARKDLANAIKRHRKQKAYSEFSLHDTMSNAAASTRLRNLQKSINSHAAGHKK